MLVQVLVRKHLRPAFEGDEARTIEHDYRVDARYQPYDPPSSTDPGTPEGFEIGAVYHSDEKTPLALTDAQIEEIREIMLDNVHATMRDELEWMERDRYTD
jgi:hypothetical protein